MYIMQSIFWKCQIKITKNLKSGLNCPVYIFGPVDIMVIDKTDSLDLFLFCLNSLQMLFNHRE